MSSVPNFPMQKMLDKAGAAIVVCGIPDKDEVFSKDYWIMDCSAASENILLACHALGSERCGQRCMSIRRGLPMSEEFSTSRNLSFPLMSYP